MVAFVTRSLHIVEVRADGHGRRWLPLGPGLSLDPHWSPDGTQLAFTAAVGTSQNVVIARPDGTRRQVNPLDTWAGEARWSPGGRSIAFEVYPVASDVGGYVVNYADLWVARADGSHPRRLLDSTATTDGNTSQATQFGFAWSWSPDGRAIATEWPAANQADANDLDIDLVNVTDGQRRVLVHGQQPSWSPDGRRIAYVTANGISIIATATGKARQLVRLRTPGTSVQAKVVAPSWSPDGTSIAYWAGIDRPRLMLVDAAGRTPPRQLFHLHGTPYPATWSSDSRSLLVSSTRGGVWILPVRSGSHAIELDKRGTDPDMHQ